MMNEERVLQRWVALELSSLGRSLVVERPTVKALLDMEEPRVINKGGEEQLIDMDPLEKVGATLSEDEKRKLKVPITFHSDLEVEQSLYLDDELAAEVLKNLGILNPMYEFREGRLWISYALVLGMRKRPPGLIQISYH